MDAVIEAEHRNQNGQAIGRKGRETRNRLIEATVALLATTRLRDLRVADIARDAGTSPATFYVYFPDVSDAVLAALGEVPQSDPEILSLVRGDWSAGDAVARAMAVVKRYLAHWLEHNALYRVRNLAADEGDQRFIDVRTNGITPLMTAIRDALERAQRADWIPAYLDPMMTAGVLLAMLERLAATQIHYNHSAEDRSSMLHAAAYMIAQMMGPPDAAS